MKNFAVIGHPVSHSKSPQLHQAGFVELEIDAEFQTKDIAPERLADWVKNEPEAFTGIAVTLPHKEAMLSLVDKLTPAAEAIGAVNTIYWENGVSVGTNTDGVGALKALQTQVPSLKNKKILILGAGGAARALVFTLDAVEAKVALWNRTASKAEKLAREFDVAVVDELNEANFGLFDIIINTTSVGLNAWESLVPESWWQSFQTAFDIVYSPLETRFLSEASDAGCTTVTGDLMLVGQALEQFKIWHGVELAPEVMGEAFFD